MLIVCKIYIELRLVSSAVVDWCVWLMFWLFDAVWNDNFIPFQNSSRSGLLKIHFLRYVSKNVCLSWLSLCSSHVKTCFLTGYFWCNGCWQIKSLWHFPSICLPWCCLAPRYKHCMHRPLFLIRVKRSFGVIIAKSWHAKYWISFEFFGPFVGTWPTLLHMLYFSWVLELW